MLKYEIHDSFVNSLGRAPERSRDLFIKEKEWQRRGRGEEHGLPTSRLCFRGIREGRRGTHYCDEGKLLCKIPKFVIPNLSVEFTIVRGTTIGLFLSLSQCTTFVEHNLSFERF